MTSEASRARAARRAAASRLSVPARIGRDFFQDRITGQYASHYHLIVSIFKGVALSSAAIAFLAIVGSREAGGVKATALGLWLTSLAAIIATYNGIMVVSIVVRSSTNVIDLVTPFIMGLAEFMQFAVLIPLSGEATTEDELAHITWWPLVFAILMLVACIGISNSKMQMRETVDRAPPEIRPLLLWYTASLRQSQISTAATSAVMGAAFLALRFGPSSLHRWQLVLAAFGTFGMANGIMATEKVRHTIAASVTPPSDEASGRPAAL